MNPQLQSNAASALISTLSDSAKSTGYNSYVFSMANSIASPTSMQYATLLPTTRSRDSLHFKITREGWLTRALLHIPIHFPQLQSDGYTAADGSEGLPMGAQGYCYNGPKMGFVNCISEIRLKTNGRVISQLNRHDLLGIVSTSPSAVKLMYGGGLRMGNNDSDFAWPRSPTVQADQSEATVDGINENHDQTGTTYSLSLDLPFMFRDLKFAMLTTFIQPLEVEVQMASNWAKYFYKTVTYSGAIGNNTANGYYQVEGDPDRRNPELVPAFGTGDDEPKIYACFRNHTEGETARVVNSNYESGLLSQLINTTFSENREDFDLPVYGTHADGVNDPDSVGWKAVTHTINLKATACIERIYFCVSACDPQVAFVPKLPQSDSSTIDDYVSKVRAQGALLELDGNVNFSSNGTAYVDMPAHLIKLYGQPSQLGMAGFSGSQNCAGSEGFTTAENLCNAAYTQNDRAICNVYCIELGTGCQDSTDISNLLSMRELSNPQLTVTVKAATVKCPSDGITPGTVGTITGSTSDTQSPPDVNKGVHLWVWYARREISTTTSSNGRYQVSLSN